MPPRSAGVAAPMSNLQLEMRSLSSNLTGTQPRISPHESYQLQILALTFSTASVASAILAFYWFVKMRRTFRHDLIMLLIQSDMFKALWFMVYPIVTFTNGPVASNSIFCQVNGFFLSIGIEASDFAILMIAIHTALYIFRPRSGGEGGLYPYRHIAYVFWVIFPLLMASLAFVNDRNAYKSEGTYCYLPVRPFWYRIALSWIPRYVIFIVILAIYASIYYYVRYKFRGFTKMRTSSTANNTSQVSEVRQSRPAKRNTLPPTPTLTCHGLIPESGQAAIVAEGRPSSSTLGPVNLRNANFGVGAHRFMWASFSAPESSPSPPSERSLNDADSFTGPSTPHPLPAAVLASPSTSVPIDSAGPAMTEELRNSSWGGAFVRQFSPKISDGSNKPSTVGMFSILRNHPDYPSNNTPLSQLHLVNSRGQNCVDAEMLRTRDKVRRQLRFLFIYPLVYIGMWIIPFASHVMQYDDNYAQNPPFALTCITTICVCCQAAIDCWLFSTREKPWRHIPGSDGSFWGSLKFWSGWNGISQQRAPQHGPGRTREEMVREARAAYQRRDEELAARRIDSFGPTNGESSKKGGERSWWENSARDGSADLGAMSPVAEEVLNPMEEIISPHVVRREGEMILDGGAISGSETLASLEKFVFEHQEDGKST